MNDLIVVGISDYKISTAPNTIATYALGSCVGTSIFDEKSRVGGLSHIMLPESSMVRAQDSTNRMKFADTALSDMVEELINNGADRKNLKAKIAGGANMFGAQSNNMYGNIGDRNVESVKSALSALKIPLIAEDTGLNYGRTVFLELASGVFKVKSIGKNINEL